MLQCLITSPSRAWLRLHAFLVLACLLACPPACLLARLLARLLACLLARLLACLLASGPLPKLSRTPFPCSFEESDRQTDGRTDGRTHAHTRSPLLGLLSEPKIKKIAKGIVPQKCIIFVPSGESWSQRWKCND